MNTDTNTAATDTNTGRNSRSIAARRAARNAAPSSASQLSAVLERIWRKVQLFAAKGGTPLPNVHLVTGMGSVPGGINLGYVTVAPIWSVAGVDATNVHELFISGEVLGMGAVRALETILHEATHLLAQVRKVKDTTRGGRYHNRQFVEQAATFELEYAHGAPSKLIGYSAVTLSEFGLVIWADELAALDAEVRAMIATTLVRRNPEDPSDDRMSPAPKVEGEPVATRIVRRRLTFGCGCRTLTMFAEDFEAGAITCHKCGEDFHR
jgi:hypothetical protein